jgi:hypothetical protein
LIAGAAAPRPGGWLWLAWVVATVLGALGGLLLAALAVPPAVTLLMQGGSALWPAILAVAALLYWGGIGVAQGMALARIIPGVRAGVWAVVSVVAAVAGLVLSVAFGWIPVAALADMLFQQPELIGDLLVAWTIYGATVMGLGQALLLRRYLRGGLWWAPAPGLGAVVGLAVLSAGWPGALPGASSDVQLGPLFLTTGVSWAGAAMLSGLVLVVLLRRAPAGTVPASPT